MPLSGLWLPRSAEEPKEQVLLCTSCGSEYPKSQRPQWERHVIKCAEAHAPEVEELIAAREASAFTSVQDKEKFAFIRRWGGLNKPRGDRRSS